MLGTGTLQRYGWWGTVLVCVLSLYAAWLEHNSALLAEDHAKSAEAVRAAARVDTVRIRQLDTVTVARGSLRRVRDTLLTRLTDTLRVKEYIAHVDTVLAADSVALVRSDALVRALATVVAEKDSELAVATLPRAEGRWRRTLEATWEPFPGVRTVSGSAAWRVLGPVSLLVRGEQRALAEAPRVGVGVQVVF